MKTIYELNEKDITRIVANEFDVDINEIKISYDMAIVDMESEEEITKSAIKMQIETECDVFNR